MIGNPKFNGLGLLLAEICVGKFIRPFGKPQAFLYSSLGFDASKTVSLRCYPKSYQLLWSYRLDKERQERLLENIRHLPRSEFLILMTVYKDCGLWVLGAKNAMLRTKQVY